MTKIIATASRKGQVFSAENIIAIPITLQHRAHKVRPACCPAGSGADRSISRLAAISASWTAKAGKNHLAQRTDAPRQFGDRIPHRGDDAKAKHHAIPVIGLFGQHGEALVVDFLGYAFRGKPEHPSTEWRVFAALQNTPRGTTCGRPDQPHTSRPRRVSRCTVLDSARFDQTGGESLCVCDSAQRRGCLPAARMHSRLLMVVWTAARCGMVKGVVR